MHEVEALNLPPDPEQALLTTVLLSLANVMKTAIELPSSALVGLLVASLDLTPANESKVSVHFATEGDFVANLRAHKLSEQNTSLFLHIEKTHC